MLDLLDLCAGVDGHPKHPLYLYDGRAPSGPGCSASPEPDGLGPSGEHPSREAALFVATSGDDAVRLGLPVEKRRAIMVILQHPREPKFLGMQWACGWQTFLTGGVEPGQTPEQAARAEIMEETGYTAAELVRVLSPTVSKFWHTPKQVNRHAFITNLHFRLRSLDCVPIADGEQTLHRPQWLTVSELATFRLPPAHRHSWLEMGTA